MEEQNININSTKRNIFYKITYQCKLLTSAVESVFIQLVSCSTAAVKATDSIGTDLFTASIGSAAFIDV